MDAGGGVEREGTGGRLCPLRPIPVACSLPGEAVRAFSQADGRDCDFRGKSLGIEVFHVDDDEGVAGGGIRSATKRFTRLYGRLAGLSARRRGGCHRGEEVPEG